MKSDLGKTLIQVAPFIIALVFFSIGIKRKKINPREIGLVRPDSWIVSFMWVVGFLFLAVVIELLLNRAGLLEVTPWAYSLPITILRILCAVILAPLVEEIFFRGILLSFLQKKGLRVAFAIVLQAALFMVLHASVYENTITGNIAIIQIFTDGLLFGMARYYTGSLFTSMTMHILGNSIAIIERLL